MSKLNINKELITYIANLSYLSLEDSEVQEYQEQLTKIINYFNEIAEFEATIPNDLRLDVLREYVKEREDVVLSSNILNDAIKQAPQGSGTAFQVPKFVDKQ